jgi:hypothetical protein
MTAHSVLSESVRLFVDHVWSLLLIAGVVLIPLGVLAWIVQGNSELATISSPASFIGYPLVLGAIACAVERVRAGLPIGLDVYSRVLPRALHMAFAVIVSVVLVLAGFVLLIVPGLIVLSRLYVVIPVLVNERRVGLGLARSWRLVKGRSWVAFRVVLVVEVVPLVLGLFFVSIGGVAVSTAAYATTLLLTTFQAIVAAVLYHRLVEGEVAAEGQAIDPRTPQLEA